MPNHRSAPDRSALARLAAIEHAPLIGAPSPLEEMTRLRAALACSARLFVKRDDAIPFAFGGNKTRKLEYVMAEALAAGADAVVTVGGVQSNHARATAAAAARFGLRCHLVINGQRPDPPRANALLDELLGASIEYIPSRDARAAALRAAVERFHAEGRKPLAIPLGASTASGALGFARAVGELLEQGSAPSVIVHAASSAGTLAGLAAGCVLHGIPTRVIGVSADDPAAEIAAHTREILTGIAERLAAPAVASAPFDVDDGFVGDGYGVPSAASREAQQLAARTEAIFVDHTYTAKALAAFIALARSGRIASGETALFWHTGGQVGLFA